MPSTKQLGAARRARARLADAQDRGEVARDPRDHLAAMDELRLSIATARRIVGGDDGPGDHHVAQLERRLVGEERADD